VDAKVTALIGNAGAGKRCATLTINTPRSQIATTGHSCANDSITRAQGKPSAT